MRSPPPSPSRHAGRKRRAPPSPEDSESEVETLPFAPRHLRRVTNRHDPVLVADNSDDDRPGPSARPPQQKRARLPSTSRSPGESPSATNRSHFDPFAIPERRGADDYLVEVLEVLPDLEAEWALTTITNAILADLPNPTAHALEQALSLEGGWPKATKATKVDLEVVEPGVPASGSSYAEPKYRRAARVGAQYYQASFVTLQDDFPCIPVPHIRNTLHLTHSLYYPTFLALRDQSTQPNKPYAELRKPRPIRGTLSAPKAKARVTPVKVKLGEGAWWDGKDGGLGEWYKEKADLDKYYNKERAQAQEAEDHRMAREIALAAGDGLECGCCFGDELVQDMIQCVEGHLFCRECVKTHAETKLGDQITIIVCMDQSSCSAAFPESELSRLLPARSLALYYRLKQNEELKAANIDGLETCPACDYAAVIDDPDEKLFRCLNDGCKQISCRKCRNKVKDHIPKTCEEMERDRKLNRRHVVEDAMSEALIRKCPKCSKPYMKESGCNKVICSGCKTITCYVCQKTVTNGYDHFDRDNGHGFPTTSQASAAQKCRLFDHEEAKHDHERVMAARQDAQGRVRRAAQEEGVELGDADLEVAAPAAPPAPRQPGHLYALPPARIQPAINWQDVGVLARHNMVAPVPRAAAVAAPMDRLRADLRQQRAFLDQAERHVGVRMAPLNAENLARLDNAYVQQQQVRAPINQAAGRVALRFAGMGRFEPPPPAPAPAPRPDIQPVHVGGNMPIDRVIRMIDDMQRGREDIANARRALDNYRDRHRGEEPRDQERPFGARNLPEDRAGAAWALRQEGIARAGPALPVRQHLAADDAPPPYEAVVRM